MSVSYHTFVGPYIKVFNPLCSKEEEYKTCFNKTCKNFKKVLNSKYCPDCGQDVATDTRMGKSSRIDFDFYKEFPKNNMMSVVIDHDSNTDYLYFVSDVVDKEGKLGYWLETEGEEKVILFNTPLKQVGEFSRVFDKELETLQKIFGIENVCVWWGVLTYVN